MSDNKKTKKSQNNENFKKIRMEPQVSPGVDFINTLNNDCLAEIFTHLSIGDRLRAQAVCKRWREKPELVWRDMRTINFESREIPRCLNRNQAIGIILKKSGNHLRQLMFGEVHSRSPVLRLIAAHCPDLKWLQIKLGGRSCIESWALLTKLEYLSLAGTPSNLSQNFFDTLDCRNLINLKLSSIGEINFNALNAACLSPTIFEKLPRLSVLSLKNFHLIDDVLMAIFHNPNLVSLSLSMCFIKGKFPSLNLINLEHLEIISTHDITDSFLSQVSKICKNLRYLKLNRIDKVTDAGLFELTKLSKLEELHLPGNRNITDEPFSRMHTLKRLTCSCPKPCDNGIITLMKYAPNLQFLNLKYSGVTVRVLLEAAKIVKERSNDLQLTIIVSYFVKSEWEPEDVSPLLVVKTKED